MDNLYEDYRLKMFASPGTFITAIDAYKTKIRTKEYGELIDYEAGDWAAVLGHGRKELTQILSDYSGQLMHTHQFFNTEHPGALVKELTLAANLMGKYKGSFLSSGTEAVSLAIALAELITGRTQKLSFNISYLGATSHLRIPRDQEQWLDLDLSECLTCTKTCDCKECDRFQDINFAQMATLVLEPGNSGGLVLIPPLKLIQYLSEEIRNAGGYIIVNEVTTGFGRTGKWFGFQHYDYFNSAANSPDIIVLGKGLGNGYPISGILIRDEIAAQIEASGYRYVQSHSDDPLGCRIARKVIEIMVKENLVDQGLKTGEYLRARLAELMNSGHGISKIRGRGMMNIAVLDKRYKVQMVFQQLLKDGHFVGFSELHNFLHFYPPLILSQEEVNSLIMSLHKILE